MGVGYIIPFSNKAMSTCLELLKEIEKAIKTGSKELILITSSNKKSLENHFNRNFELEYSLDKNRKYELLKNDEKYNSRKYKLFLYSQNL